MFTIFNDFLHAIIFELYLTTFLIVALFVALTVLSTFALLTADNQDEHSE